MIEMGKYYRTRSGSKAYVVGGSPFPPPYWCKDEVYGFIDGLGGVFTWKQLTGRCKGAESLDLVKEWQDLKQGILWVNIYPDPQRNTVHHTEVEALKAAGPECILSAPLIWREKE